jgi:hypothetical protein
MAEDNPGSIQAASAVELAVVTYFYMCSAGMMAKASDRLGDETEAQNRRGFRPVLDTELESPSFSPYSQGDFPEYITATIRNIGSGPALNVVGFEPADLELGSEGGKVTLGSIGVLQQVSQKWIAIMDNTVSVEYADLFDREYRSSRAFKVEDLQSGSMYFLDVLVVTEEHQ